MICKKRKTKSLWLPVSSEIVGKENGFVFNECVLNEGLLVLVTIVNIFSLFLKGK